MPFIMANFIERMTNEDSDQLYWVFGLIAMAIFVTFTTSLLKEHALKYICQVKSKTG